MNATIELKETSQEISYTNVKNTYEKGSFYCVYKSDDIVEKFPVSDVFRVKESYKRITNEQERN